MRLFYVMKSNFYVFIWKCVSIANISVELYMEDVRYMEDVNR